VLLEGELTTLTVSNPWHRAVLHAEELAHRDWYETFGPLLEADEGSANGG